jgi:hypothetical protein
MNCQIFESIVNELARQQMMEANARDQALAHADECGVCAQRLADERALTQKLRELTTEMSGLEAPARIEGELLAAFRQQTVGGRFTSQARSANRNWSYWVTAAAAVLLIVIGIAAMSMRLQPTPRAAEGPYIPPFRPAVAEAPKALKAPESPVIVDGDESLALPKQGPLVVSHRPRRHAKPVGVQSKSAGSQVDKGGLVVDNDSIVAANYENEIATEFMPVGYASPLGLQDGGQVMRVELDRSALAGFGLPVNMDRVNEKVKADVLVGSDGQARAIRFVQ